MALELNLTAARHSMWDAIDNWPDTAGVFATAFRFDKAVDQIDFQGGFPVISISDFPAIMILPTSIVPQWFAAQMARWRIVYSVVIWTQDWALLEGEELIEKVSDAIFRAAPAGSSLTYVRNATRLPPYLPNSLTPLFVKTGDNQETKATMWKLDVGLSELKDPYGP